MKSIWSETTTFQERPRLRQDLKADVAVIGGGMAGILIGHSLAERGAKVVILEASRVGSGQTQNTTAKITSQHGLIYGMLIQKFGEESARQYADANREAISEYRRIIKALSVDCSLEERPAYLYSTKAAEPLREEAKCASKLGIEAVFTTETALPFAVCGAVRFDGQAQFHPLHFLKALSERLEVYEQTKVIKVEGNKAYTEEAVVTAEHIVFATHYPFVNVPGYYFLRMHQSRSYLLALEGASRLDGMYLGVDSDGYTLRNSGNLLLFGGGDHRTGENSAGGRYETFRRAAKQYFPESKEIASWSAQDCITIDSVPYIGRYSDSTPNWYVATGFRKWGMTGSMVAARILSGLICGEKPPYAEVFSPQRFVLSASAKSLWEEGKQAVKGLTQKNFIPPREKMQHLENGHGGIVEWNGEKTGVYKDASGQVFAVPVKCPHLGCQLEWNPDEKSWDCPCHGSRFDYMGKLIDNPAQEDLTEHG